MFTHSDYMNRTRVCFVTHSFLPNVGGIERVIYEQSIRLIAEGFEPTVLTSSIKKEERYTLDGIKVECYPAVRMGFRLGIPYPIPHPKSYKIFLENVRRNDIIHAHGHPYPSSYISLKMARKYSKPFLVTQHNTFIEYGPFFSTAEKVNDILLGSRVLRESGRVIVVSKATQDYVLELGANSDKVEVIYNGVDLDRFKPLKRDKNRIRKKWRIPKDHKVVLSVRRLVYKNGIDTLIKCAQQVIKQHSKVIFVTVGKGPDFDRIKNKIKELKMEDKFILAGFISEEELPHYYNIADVFVLPSKSGEGLPLVLLEAMACGVPIVATNTGGVSEIISENQGRIVPTDDSSTMAKEILSIMQKKNSSTCEQLRETVKKEYSWERNVDKLMQIYGKLLERA